MFAFRLMDPSVIVNTSLISEDSCIIIIDILIFHSYGVYNSCSALTRVDTEA